MAGRVCIGWVSGDTQKQVSVSDANWKRLGQFTASKVQLLARGNGLVVSRQPIACFGGIEPHSASAALIPTLTFQVERGASRLFAKNSLWVVPVL
jgi:hypothetical protein